jgi:Tol biopolymer transport system component/PKD repeat protein
MAPASASTNYTYTVSVDNTNALVLNFTWVLVDSQGNERILGTNSSTVDGIVSSPPISGAAMGPADNYTLRVDVDSLASTYKCSLSAALVVGVLNVDYTFNVNNNAVEVGQDICLTNISNTSHGDINALTYSWDFGSAVNSLNTQTSTAQQPGCLSFPNPGTYVITLTGTNASGNRSASKSYTFHVYGTQSIAINHSNQSIAPAMMSFSAVSLNVNAPYNWTFRDVDTNTIVGTRTGQNVTFNFLNPGNYEATVSASGPLGVTTATAQFTLLAVDDIRAAFTPSTYNGPAPLYVCFTDRSVGNNITSWAWDFNNDGVTDSTQQNPCTTFTSPSTPYPVKLTIQNSSNKTATASNIIHTFNALESHSTFTIIPKGSGLYCFQSQVDGSTTVTSWDFGDGTTLSTGNLNYVCHQFSSSGSYAVTMNISSPPDSGKITRPVDVVLTANPPTPTLVVSGSCTIAGGAVFTVSNTGSSMVTPDSLKITDAGGAVVVVDDTLKLANGQSKSYTVMNSYGTLTLTTVDTSLTFTTYCNHPPALTGSAVCQPDGSVQFIINNSSSDTDASQSYTVTDGNNNTVQTGTITAAKNGSQTITVSGYYPALTFTTSGTPAASTTITLSSSCSQPPVLAISAICRADGAVIFTITNSSKDTDAHQSYTVTDVNGTVMQSGLVTAPANGGTTIIEIDQAYQNTPVTLTSSGGAQGATTLLSLSQSCAEPPVLSGSAVCSGDSVAFTIHNSSKDTDASQPYSITKDGAVVDKGTLMVAAGKTATITLSHGYGVFTFTTSSPTQGATASLTVDMNCAEPGSSAVALDLTPTPLPIEAQAGIPVNVAGSPTCSRGCIDLQVYHTNRNNGHWDIYRLVHDANGQPDSDINLTDTNGKFDNMAPSRSPNAEWIVFTSNRDGNWELYLAPTDGNISQTRRLTFNETAIDTDPVWGPNNFVVFETNRNGNWDLYLLDMTTGKFYQLTTSKGNDVNPSWSNDGTRLAFQSDRSGQWQIYEMDLTTFHIRLLSDGKGSDMDPVYSEDNSRIAFRSDRDGAKSQLYIMDANGANPTPISDKGGYATNQSWSPDDHLIAYQSDLDGDLDIYVYDVNTRQTRKLTNNSIADYAPTWRCAINQVIFTSDVNGAPDIFEAKPLPISDPGIAVDKQADQLTQYPADNIYPEGMPVEENASREGRLPDLSSILTGETSFLKPDVSIIPPDISRDTGTAWEDIGNTCAPSGTRHDLTSGA